MRIVIFGLSVTSSWGNGHATLLRGLFRALWDLGHRVHFFERDVPYYAMHRDMDSLPYAQVHLYREWAEVRREAERIVASSDVGMVTSYCPDGAAACDLVLNSTVPRTIFYDMDTPVTLSRLDRGETVDYLPRDGLGRFHLVLSYTGGCALDRLRDSLKARRAAALYGWVDSSTYQRAKPSIHFDADLSYLGTYSSDRQAALERLMIAPAELLPRRKFLVAGAMHESLPNWPSNVRLLDHVAPPQHTAFYSSVPLTLNVTRGSMAAMGFCPSGRLFEAAACGTAVLSDWWSGLGEFFQPGEEILIAGSTAESVAAIAGGSVNLQKIGLRARERVLDCHTAGIRARRLLTLLETPRNEISSPACGSYV